ncbi:plastocyanin/azurin family copper-binding protein [Halobellus captivus]|uniref:plastocyanin/azurin family copper-binding protein n=1 Tax=Halobellus captivus TaxID=2592614 RepID=UPI0011A38276|nr:plastocyanin/azurin family copper-binding protein [Halobellus captivus]
MAQPSNRLSRRGFIRAGAVGTAASATPATVAAQEGERHTVEMTDELVFDPDEITIAPGDTVVWENVGGIGHSVTAYEDEIPADAAYFASGGFDSESAARSAYSPGDVESGDILEDGTYEHTFEIEGTYEYFCIPHETVGMLGSVEVAPGGGSDDGGGVSVPTVPDTAKTLLIATTGALVAVVALAYFFLKYGGDYEISDDERN